MWAEGNLASPGSGGNAQPAKQIVKVWPVRWKEKPGVLETGDKCISRKCVKTLHLSLDLATVGVIARF